MTNQTTPNRRRYPAEYKFKILAEYDALDRDGKGELLRREQLYTSLLSEWRKQRDRGALEALAAAPGRPSIDRLERENAQLRARVHNLERGLDQARKALEAQGELSTMLKRLARAKADPLTDGETR